MTNHETTPLYREILACLERQRPLILAHHTLVSGTPEEREALAKIAIEDDIYDELFAKYAKEALSNPTMQHVGELTALWRFRAYDDDGRPKGFIIEDDYEAQLLFRVIEKLTGVDVPKRPFHGYDGSQLGAHANP